MQARTPTLVIMEYLRDAGWTRGPAPALHLEDSPKLFGNEHFSRRKCYFQCLVARARLATQGLQELPSGESEWYYRAVLSAAQPAAVPRGQSAKQYKALMYGEDSQLALQDCQPIHQQQALCDDVGHDNESDSSEAIVGFRLRRDDPAPEPRPPLPLPPLLPGDGAIVAAEGVQRPGSPSSSSSSSGSSASGQARPVVIRAGIADGGAFRLPVHECIKVEEHLQPGQPGHYRRYTTVCPLAKTGHCSVVACGKRRNCGKSQMGQLGPAAPEAFLMVWRNAAVSFATKADHQRWTPTVAEVRQFMIEQGWPVGPS